MKVAVLMNLERLQEVAKGSKTFFIKNGEREWILDDNTFKFIILRDETLVIGPILDHGALYAIYQSWEMSVAEASEYIRAFDLAGGSSARTDWHAPITGAGAVSSDGKVTSWESRGFRVETQQHMREEIEMSIAKEVQSGALTLR